MGPKISGPVIHIYEEQRLKFCCKGHRTLFHPVPDKQQQAHSLETGVISWWYTEGPKLHRHKQIFDAHYG